jgi:RNA polymerase sigma-54 factor
MALELRQQLKLTQQLVMTPQLQQAIKLLQLSRLELLESVQQELMENPFLDEGAADMPAEGPGSEDAAPEPSDDTGEMGADAGEKAEELIRNADWEDYLGEFSSSSRQVQVRETEVPEDVLPYEARLAVKPSLEGHLEWQLRLSRLSEEQMAIGEAIIGNLDSAGYLQASTEDLAKLTGADEESVEEVIRQVQLFDPVGVAARDPQECLLVQLRLHGMDQDPVLVEIVKEHLGDLEKRRYKPLARKFKISMEDIKRYLDMLQKLDPMPGASFGSSEPFYVSPDVFVYKFDEEFIIVLNEEGLPKLQLNSFYMDSLKAQSEKDKEYFQEKMRSAVWLMKSLYQRQRTLYKVVESIVKYQRPFFEEGITRLRPLILKDIAEDINMHESTVSRITTSKYVATPHGVYELKFFFNSALGLEDGSQVGSESVKALIKQLIDGENPKKPLSDERIAEMLKDKLQVNIARRTVAKYRTALDIPSSSKRKEVF